MHIIDEENLEYAHFDYQVGLSIPTNGMITPLLSSIDIRCDTCINAMVNDKLIAIFITEMHSGTSILSYQNTVCKGISNSIDLFRLLRIYNSDIASVSTFVFPKFTDKTRVTRIDVSFRVESLQFEVCTKELTLKMVKQELTSVLKNLQSVIDDIPHQLINNSYFMKLNTMELVKLTKIVGAKKTLEKIRSSHSLVFTDKKHYWKLVISSHEAIAIATYFSRFRDAHVLQYSLTTLEIKGFFKSDALVSPLLFNEVYKCLKDFLLLVKTALQSLHKIKLAHLDVRIPNICFKLEGVRHIAVLVDLDRSCSATSTLVPSFDGESYKKPPTWTLQKLDWKQVGLMAENIMHGHGEFVSKLINQGRYMCYNI